MNRTYRKNIIRTIRSTLSRFLAIFAIVALGVGFLAGLLCSPLDMRLSAEKYYDDTDMYDLRIVSTMGLTEDDAEAVRTLDGVSQVLPVEDTDLVLRSEEGDNYTTRILTLPEDSATEMNTPVLIEGRLPKKAGEIAIVKTKGIVEAESFIGQTFAYAPDDEEERDENIPELFTVVGTVKSSMYHSMEQEHTTAGTGIISLMAYTLPETFIYDYYTGFYLTLDGAKDLPSFEEEYEEKTDAAVELLETLGEERSELRYEEIVGDATAELDDAKAEYEEGKAEAEKELADALKTIEDGEKELADNEQLLADSKRDLEDGQAQLDSNRATFEREINSARAQIADGRAQIQNYQAQLDDAAAPVKEAQAQLDAGYAQLDETDALLAQTKTELDAAQSNLDALAAGKNALWQTAAQLGIPVSDTSDTAAITLITQLEAVSPEAGAGFAQLKAGLEALAAQGTDVDTSLAALEAGRAEYEQGLAAAQAARAELDAAQAQLDEQSAPLREQQALLDAQKAQLDNSEATLNSTVVTTQRQLQSAQAEINDGWEQYNDGISQLEDAKKELEDGRKEYEEGKLEAEQELADAWEQIEDAEDEIAELAEGEWYIFTREDNVSYSSYDGNADKIAAIATVFPLFFFLVAALVALTTMTRMVEEERGQIGTMKALGYSTAKIASKYLIYAAIAGVSGSLFGVLVFMKLFPYIIITAYNIMYDIPQVVAPYHLIYAALSAITAIACTLIATYSACRSILKEVPARLMMPKAPKAGKRVFLEYVTPIWKRLKFTQKVTVRNLFRYKKRLFMTVIGVSGCTALLVTGFGLRDSISDIVELQYNEIYSYQLSFNISDETALDTRSMQAILEDDTRVTDHLTVHQSEAEIVPDGGDPKDNFVIFVPSDMEKVTQYIGFRHRTDSEPVTVDENSVIITEKLSERQNLEVGDELTVKTIDEVEATFTITDICENYVYHYLYISPAAYEAAFGEKAEVNTVLCKLPVEPEPSEEELGAALLRCRDVVGVTFTSGLSESFENTIESLNLIIIVIILCAAALAFVVLYNLTNINITEREKEIATIKVLGFFDKEVSAYIFREVIALTVIGAAVGLVLGMFLHKFIILTVEVDIVMFGREVYPLSYVWSALMTMLFSLIVDFAMFWKLKAVSMVESMKAPE